MAIENPKLFKEYMQEMMKTTPATVALRKEDEKDDFNQERYSRLKEIVALEKAFFMGQFLRAEGHDTDQLGLTLQLKNILIDAYAQVQITETTQRNLSYFNEHVMDPSNDFLRQHFPERFPTPTPPR